MTDYRPAAQAALDAMSEWFTVDDDERQALGAAIRAVADQVVPALHIQQSYDSCCDVHKAAIRKQLLNIATELETNS
jgi:hypothetical protein